MPDEMQDPRIAEMLARRNQFRDRNTAMDQRQQQMAGQFQGGLSLPEMPQRPPMDPSAMNQMKAQWNMPESNYNPDMQAERQMPDRQEMMRQMNERQNQQSMMQRPPMPQRQLPAMSQGQPQGQPFNQPAPQGTTATAPMANTMNPNAPSARPSMGRPNMNRGQMMGRRAQMMGKQPAGSEVGGTAPRSVTPF